MSGPPPKRSDQRRRTNKPTMPIDRVAGAPGVRPPPTNGKWHPVAKRWYRSLRDSGQSVFYEPSDWATAYLIADSISRELAPQPVVSKDGDVTWVSMPPKGASLVAWLRAMTSLMVTEGDRRRLRLELQKPEGDGEEEAAGVSELDEYRRRLHGSPG